MNCLELRDNDFIGSKEIIEIRLLQLKERTAILSKIFDYAEM